MEKLNKNGSTISQPYERSSLRWFVDEDVIIITATNVTESKASLVGRPLGEMILNKP
jgi:hypothetical protein